MSFHYTTQCPLWVYDPGTMYVEMKCQIGSSKEPGNRESCHFSPVNGFEFWTDSASIIFTPFISESQCFLVLTVGDLNFLPWTIHILNFYFCCPKRDIFFTLLIIGWTFMKMMISWHAWFGAGCSGIEALEGRRNGNDGGWLRLRSKLRDFVS